MKPRVGLFVTCLVDLMRPSVGFAAVKLIEYAGCSVEVPSGQTCCGQPAYNAGNSPDARALALQTVRAFKGCDYVVAPSGSCAAMLKLHYPRLFAGEGDTEFEIKGFCERVHELTSFLVNVRGVTSVPGSFRGRVTYHDACSGLRELSIKSAPRKLLKTMDGVELAEMDDQESCCGFGGLFSVKYPEISNAIVEKKVAAASAASAGLLLGGDLGCLMNIAGKMRRDGSGVRCRHVAEVLAGELREPPIAQGE